MKDGMGGGRAGGGETENTKMGRWRRTLRDLTCIVMLRIGDMGYKGASLIRKKGGNRKEASIT